MTGAERERIPLQDAQLIACAGCSTCADEMGLGMLPPPWERTEAAARAIAARLERERGTS